METTNIYKKLFEVKKAWIKLQRDTKAFNYKYATLSQIQEKLSTEIEKQGLVIVHLVHEWNVITRIADIETAEHLQSSIPMTPWIKAQDKWSEITYYRRYNLLSLLDLEVEDDDWKKWSQKPTNKPVKEQGITDHELSQLEWKEWMDRFREETDINVLKTDWDTFILWSWSPKQIEIATEVKNKTKNKLIK